MSSKGLDTIGAGVRCRDVLADLSDFLDGALPAERVAELQAHLAGCDNCAQFGGHITHTLTVLRRDEARIDRDYTDAVLARIRATG
jgi:anti-sigma factor RsiW